VIRLRALLRQNHIHFNLLRSQLIINYMSWQIVPGNSERKLGQWDSSDASTIIDIHDSMTAFLDSLSLNFLGCEDLGSYIVDINVIFDL
jgi:hypothetical protein